MCIDWNFVPTRKIINSTDFNKYDLHLVCDSIFCCMGKPLQSHLLTDGYWARLNILGNKILRRLWKSQFSQLSSPHDITQCAKNVHTARCRNQRRASPRTNLNNSDKDPAKQLIYQNYNRYGLVKQDGTFSTPLSNQTLTSGKHTVALSCSSLMSLKKLLPVGFRRSRWQF